MIGKRNAIFKESESVFVGIGANLGTPREVVEIALEEVSELAVGEVISSSIWWSEASGMAGDDFANAVVKFEFGDSPLELLDKLQALEVKHGRAADHGHHTSRTLDLDIIAFGHQLISCSRLRVPHAYACERLFVLLPLREIDPEFRFVNRDESLNHLIDRAERIKIALWKPEA